MQQSSLIIIFLSLTLASCRDGNRETDKKKLDRGADLASSGKFIEAINLYSVVIRRNPKIQLAYYNRGICYLELQEYSKALFDFESVINLQTVNGMILWKNSDFYNSDEAVGQVPHKDVVFQRAIAKAELDSFASSFADFQNLINANYEEKSNCMLWQGTILGRMGRPSKACEYFEKAKQIAVTEEDLKAATDALTKYCEK